MRRRGPLCRSKHEGLAPMLSSPICGGNFQRCRFEDMGNESIGVPWALARAKYVSLTDSAEDVQEWRAKQVANRKPSTLKDYCASHGRCIRRESTGIVLDEKRGGFKSAGSYEGANPSCPLDRRTFRAIPPSLWLWRRNQLIDMVGERGFEPVRYSVFFASYRVSL